MGYFNDKADEVQNHIEGGQIEAAADATIHALLEGDSTHADNLNSLYKAMKENRE